MDTGIPEAPPEILDVPAGVLSRVRESDAGQLARAVEVSLEYLWPFMPWATKNAADVQAQLARCREAEQAWDRGGDYIYVLRPEPSGPVIGNFGLHRRVGKGAVEIGYWVHVDFAGRGYATACAGALTRAGLDLPGVQRIEIHTDEANVISAAIPRRLGYRLARVDERAPEAPAETGRLQIWIMERPG